LTGGILLVELVALYVTWPQGAQVIADAVPAMDVAAAVTNTESLGQILYTKYAFPFQIAGLVLFVAMIGAIVLTHRVRPGVRKQNIAAQHARKPEEAMEIQKVTTGSGA
jgi:NADH-quinone oxidoreductase subunit J